MEFPKNGLFYYLAPLQLWGMDKDKKHELILKMFMSLLADNKLEKLKDEELTAILLEYAEAIVDFTEPI